LNRPLAFDGGYHSSCLGARNVRFGSDSGLDAPKHEVRFAPINRHRQIGAARPKRANHKSLFNYSLAELICRNVGLAVCRQSCASLPHGGRAPVSTGERIKQSREGCMTVAGQAFLLTGELFLLSFAAIFVIWFADRLRRDFIGKP